MQISTRGGGGVKWVENLLGITVLLIKVSGSLL